MSYITNTTAKDSVLPISLQEAKEHLRIVSGDLDGNIRIALNAAVDYCERFTGRSLRLSKAITQTYSAWPGSPIRFDRHPVKSITSITYYDSDNVQQTVLASNYRLITSSDSAASLSFVSDYSFPSYYSRDDAVQITYVAGYGTIDAIPASAKYAILLQLEKTFGDKAPIEQNAIERSVASLLISCDWGGYR